MSRLFLQMDGQRVGLQLGKDHRLEALFVCPLCGRTTCHPAARVLETRHLHCRCGGHQLTLSAAEASRLEKIVSDLERRFRHLGTDVKSRESFRPPA